MKVAILIAVIGLIVGLIVGIKRAKKPYCNVFFEWMKGFFISYIIVIIVGCIVVVTVLENSTINGFGKRIYIEESTLVIKEDFIEFKEAGGKYPVRIKVDKYNIYIREEFVNNAFIIIDEYTTGNKHIDFWLSDLLESKKIVQILLGGRYDEIW